jgi:hypothetical protein
LQQVFNLTQPLHHSGAKLIGSVNQNPSLDNLSPPSALGQPQQPLVHWNQNHNSIIDNLSTLRSSDINERERNFIEKIKALKNENRTLVTLLKDNEGAISDKITRTKKETE